MTATATSARALGTVAFLVGAAVGLCCARVAAQLEQAAATQSLIREVAERLPGGGRIAVTESVSPMGLPVETIAYPEGLEPGVVSIVDITCSGSGATTVEVVEVKDLEDPHQGPSIGMDEQDGVSVQGLHLLSSVTSEEHAHWFQSRGIAADAQETGGSRILRFRLPAPVAAREIDTFLRSAGAGWLEAKGWMARNPSAPRARRLRWAESLP